MRYFTEETDSFIEDVELHQKSGQQKLILKILSFLKELEVAPTKGTGKPEALKGYGERSVWSRRIDQKHRLVYEVLEDEKVVKMLSAWGHYK